jgi:uncharacterized membrane protein YfcA
MFYLLLTLFGCLTGISAVLFGFGGGFVIVPLLYRMLTASHAADDPIAQSAMHIAVATSTCVMIVNALPHANTNARAICSGTTSGHWAGLSAWARSSAPSLPCGSAAK